MSPIFDRPLSRYLQPDDYQAFDPDVWHAVDGHFTKDRPQHEARRWEYALALAAIRAWGETLPDSERSLPRIADVGGAGSPFWRMVDGSSVQVIDPDAPMRPLTLDAYVHGHSWDAVQPSLFDVVTCLSVIEHVDPTELDGFLYHLTCLLRPGGLLVLTCDACGCTGGAWHAPTADPHHFHWMRRQIVTRPLLLEIMQRLADCQCTFLGGVDVHQPPVPTVYDYTFASLVMQKRSR